MKIYFSQKDSKWRDKLLGYGRTNFGSSGCAIISFANFQLYNGEKDTPLDINETAKKCGAFSGDMLTFGILAKKLGYTYLKTTVEPTDVCIAETDNYKKVGVPQHFFLFKPENGKRVDPLDLAPQWEDNTYKIVSYRVLKTIQITPEPIQPPEKPSDIPSPVPPTMPPEALESSESVFNDQPTYQSLQNPRSQFFQLISDLWFLIRGLFK